jgi:hypothetical protein
MMGCCCHAAFGSSQSDVVSPFDELRMTSQLHPYTDRERSARSGSPTRGNKPDIALSLRARTVGVGGTDRMQQTDRIDVLTTQLAATDRRALSQAWYSALHLAERSAQGSRAIAARCGPAASSVAREPVPRTPLRAPSAAHAAAARRRTAVRGRETPHRAVVASSRTERREPKTALAQHLERALIRRVPRAPATSFALRAGLGRVHLLVRSDGQRTRVIAVCSPSVRERVERALAQARFALAGRGVAAEVV